MEREGTASDALAGLNENFIAKFNGLPIAHGHVQTQGRPYPVVVFADSSDADAPTPLYAVSRRDGHFLEHYAMPSWGDAQVYTVINGFKIPRYDVFNARNLADENSPGFAAYGYDYSVRLQVARDGLFPALRNRIDANSYRLAGEGALLRLGKTEATERRRSFNYGELHNASTQAVRIASLPSLA
ncbi:MAG: hypothetical protein EXS31_16970 [Pedosphaera sp.]|nr:hypothetical protein [Pedosphaera sp.]